MSIQTTDPAQIQATPSFIGLQSYTEAQADKFFGRDSEIETLTNLVESNTLTIIFGKSGTGKTSLLNAGVFPKLRKEYCLPFRIRLEFRDDSPDLITQIKNVLKQEIDKYGFTVEGYPAGETLWEYFHKEPLWNAVTPILVFDQFEEIFTLARKNDRFNIKEQETFWEELADLIENSIPEKLKEQFLNSKEEIGYSYRKQKAKIVFSFREEFLPEFESITSKIPSIKFSRFRLLTMNGNQAYDVITKTWKENISAAEAKQIVSFFTHESDNESYDLITVEPSLLSQVCSFIDKERIEEGTNKVSAELLKKYPKETVLRSIYEEALVESNNALARVEPTAAGELQTNPVKEFIEEKMITSEGYRTKYSLSENDQYVRPGIEVLISKYMIREDDNKVELTHDILAPIVKTDRENRRKQAALIAERKRAKRKAFIILLAALLIGVGIFGIAEWQRAKAIDKRDAANLETMSINAANDSLLSQIKLDSLKLLAIQKKINASGGRDTSRASGSTNKQDSIDLAQLRTSYDDLSEELRIKRLRLDSLVFQYEKVLMEINQKSAISDAAYKDAEKNILDLKSKVALASSSRDSLHRELTALTIRFNNLNDLYQALMIKKYPPIASIDTNFNLKLNLYYGSSKKTRVKAPGNLSIFLIPDIINNQKIIRQAKLYEIHCDDNSLRKANNYKVATYYNGQYGFTDLPAGKYFVKICTYYGGYYTFTKKSDGKEEIEWDASPPIR